MELATATKQKRLANSAAQRSNKNGIVFHLNARVQRTHADTQADNIVVNID